MLEIVKVVVNQDVAGGGRRRWETGEVRQGGECWEWIIW